MNIRRLTALILMAAMLCTALAGCGNREPAPTPDPHEGQVYLYDGYDWVWYTPLEGVETNSLGKEDFVYSGGMPLYVGQEYKVLRGIDVSEHQKEIDWYSVGNCGFDFIYVRAGRRGYTQGGLFDDEYFARNMAGAAGTGAKLGVYFFSQAISVAEAIEEANFVLEKIAKYDVTMPIAFDWEKVDDPEARTKDLSVQTLTDCAVAFCETIKAAGYEPCVYYNRTTGYYRFDLSRLKDYKVWFALPCTPPDVTFPSFYYHIDMWQYDLAGKVPGIGVETDLNYMFVPAGQT